MRQGHTASLKNLSFCWHVTKGSIHLGKQCLQLCCQYGPSLHLDVVDRHMLVPPRTWRWWCQWRGSTDCRERAVGHRPSQRRLPLPNYNTWTSLTTLTTILCTPQWPYMQLVHGQSVNCVLKQVALVVGSGQKVVGGVTGRWCPSGCEIWWTGDLPTGQQSTWERTQSTTP